MTRQPMFANPYIDEVAHAYDCAEYISNHRQGVLGALTKFETHRTAEDEIASSIDALRNLHRELPHLRRGSAGNVAVFLPINLPLYSLVLFGAVPSLMADRVDVRVPAATPEWVLSVAREAGLERFFPRLRLHRETRRAFIDNYVTKASAVVFTGRHESAEQVRAQCPRSLFVFQGSGVNPIVLGPQADLSPAVMDRLMEARLFNGGQDCAAPDVFLVHEAKAAAFVGSLVDKLRHVRCGDLSDPGVRVGSILNPQTVKDLETRLRALRSDIVVGGRVERERAMVEPTVVVRPVSEHDEVTELFGPVFYVLVYENDDQLAEFLGRPECVDNAMYVSLFGQRPVPGLFETATVLFDQTVLDVEQGNTAFGGFGAKSNYVAYRGRVEVGPALISEALQPVARPVGLAAYEPPALSAAAM